MSAQHTPGPWVAKYSPRHEIEVFAPDASMVITRVFLPVADYETDEANARLIAEAPAMLVALRAVDAWITDLGPFAESGHEPAPVFKAVSAILARIGETE